MPGQEQAVATETPTTDQTTDLDTGTGFSQERGNSAMADSVARLRGGGAGLGARIPISPALLALMGDGSAGANTGASDPDVKSGHDYKYKEIKGTRWEKGAGDANEVDPNDVDQGALGDCYLHAAMAAIARANPDAIKKLIKDNGDGTYDVSLHMDVSGDWIPWAVDHVERVTSSFPVDAGGTPAYAGNSKSADGAELWVMLIEKAYAQAKGGYGSIESGNAGDAMDILGWGGHQLTYTSSLTEDKIGETIETALKGNKPVTAGTPDFSKKDDAFKKAADAADIHGDHAYAVIKVDRKAGTIDLQNPWGPGTGKNGLRLADFKKFFTHIEIGN